MAPPSIEHVASAMPDKSVAVKLTATVAPTVAPADGAVIETVGPVVSTTKLRETGVELLPDVSVAVIVTVCDPSASPE